MDCSTPGFPIHHQLPELAQTHVHQVGDAIQSSHPLSFPSPPAFKLSHHQGLYNKWVLRIRWPKNWSFSFSISPFNESSGLISFRIDWFDLFAVQGTLESTPTPQFKSISFWCSAFFMAQLLHPHTIWEDHKRWTAEGNRFFTKSRINCISLEKRYLYLCTKFMFTSGTPFKKMNKDTSQVKAGLGPIIPLLLIPLQPCMPSCRFCCTLCKLPHQGLCTCSCLFHLKCSWWKCAHGSPAPFLGSWLKEHLYRRACSGHSTPNTIIHFLAPFLFYFSSLHCLLFYFMHQEYTTYLCISVLQHLEE